MSTIRELQALLNGYNRAQKDLDEVEKLIHLSTTKSVLEKSTKLKEN